MHPTPCTLLKSAAPGEKCGLVAFRSPSCPFVDIFFGRRGSASIPPPHQPSPGGSASATSPRGGSDSGVQTGNILYTINPERGRPHLGARGSRPHLIPANNLPSTAAPLQSAPNPPLRGSLPSCQALCGRDARAPRGGPFDRLHCLHRLIREGCQRNERCEKSLQCTSSAMEADGLFVHQQRSDASLIPGIHTNGKLCFWNESPTLTAYLGWSSPGSAGVPPASLFLQTASQPRPLPRKVHQTRLYGVLFPRARSCAGETPAFPGGLVRAGRPRSQEDLSMGLRLRPSAAAASRLVWILRCRSGDSVASFPNAWPHPE